MWYPTEDIGTGLQGNINPSLKPLAFGAEST